MFHKDTGFVWCEFKRPVVATDLYELDLSEKMYQFYFWGQLDDMGRPVLPAKSRIERSGVRLNASEIFNDVEYDPDYMGSGGGQSALSSHSMQLGVAAGLLAVTLVGRKVVGY